MSHHDIICAIAALGIPAACWLFVALCNWATKNEDIGP